MIVDRYPPVNLFAVVPKLVADFEPELRELDRLLEDDELFARVKRDLGGRRPHSLTRGRHSTPGEASAGRADGARPPGVSYAHSERAAPGATGASARATEGRGGCRGNASGLCAANRDRAAE